MLKSLYAKLTLAFVLIAFTTAVLIAVAIRLSSADRLTQLIVDQQRTTLEQTLSQYYVTNGSWNGVDQNWQNIQFRPSSTQAPPLPDRPPQGGIHAGGGTAGRVSFMGLADASGKVIVSVDPQYPDGSILPAAVIKGATPILANGQQVGSILTARQPPGFNAQESLYLQRTTQALIFAGLGALVVAFIIGILLARTLTRPLRALTRASQGISQGQLEQQVIVRSNDEMGQLATAFNSMSQEVSRVNQQRKQMTADIAHDLRTPLTVISGYIESMRDGVLKPTPQRFDLIYSEIERLQDLVGDLRVLSLADAGELSLNPQQISPKQLLDKAADLFRHQAEQQDVRLEVDAANDLPEIRVDEARMMQVLGNLITNSLRYTPPQGQVTLSAHVSDRQLEICVQDTGEGIPAGDLPFIFDRFQRSDKSRHTEASESGLGLAIVKALVELHHGTVSVESTLGLGATFQLRFPLN